MKPACSVCGYVHAADEVVAISRFDCGEDLYRARFSGAVVRSTREEAEADMCGWRGGRRPDALAHVLTMPAARPTVTATESELIAPQSFPAATVEHLGREKAWRDFLAQAAFSLHIWTLDGSLADVLPSPVDWLRACADDLSALIAKETTT